MGGVGDGEQFVRHDLRSSKRGRGAARPQRFNQLTRVTGNDGATTGFGYDGNGNQVTKVERPAGGAARTWTYAYDLDNRLVNVSSHTELPAPTQWASGATASSSLFPNGAAAATGAPDTSVCGTTATAWAPMPMPWSGSEWLQASYAAATRARGVRIHETGGAPFVKQVELVEPGGARHTVWSGQDATACGGYLTVGFEETGYPVAGVKVTTTAGMNLGLDAVGLDPAPAAGPETQVAAYQYDANGLRVRREDSGGERRFLLDGLSIAAEYGPTGGREAWYTQSLARIDEPLNVVNGQGKYWYQADALGSAYALTTSTGAVQARGGYDVFGAPVAKGGAAVGQRFGFTGREHEVESGLVYARDRYLLPTYGFWLTPDRLLGAINQVEHVRLATLMRQVRPERPPLKGRYSYAGLRPTQFVDPLGFYSATANFFLWEVGTPWINYGLAYIDIFVRGYCPSGFGSAYADHYIGIGVNGGYGSPFAAVEWTDDLKSRNPSQRPHSSDPEGLLGLAGAGIADLSLGGWGIGIDVFNMFTDRALETDGPGRANSSYGDEFGIDFTVGVDLVYVWRLND